MDQFTVLVIASCSALAFGGIIGLIIGRASSSPEQRQQLQKNLDSTKRELDSYKDEVTEHFTRTAELVNNLTESYREVHQHLAKSADTLCDGNELSHRLETPMASSALEQTESAEAPSAESPADAPTETGEKKKSSEVEPPKDYAPKTDPEAEGTLSENFGLQSGNDEPLQHDPTKTADHAKD
ncbi:MAG: DUF1043 family protein [Motiliproteus sp.]|nr:DUF1043 family protein [Motiliproteus sp.]MCW9051018.1 DUF1043 family protein [Motiliproteus sp.]